MFDILKKKIMIKIRQNPHMRLKKIMIKILHNPHMRFKTQNIT